MFTILVTPHQNPEYAFLMQKEGFEKWWTEEHDGQYSPPIIQAQIDRVNAGETVEDDTWKVELWIL